MDMSERVPDAVARRLPWYYRTLRELEAEETQRVSSQALGRRMGLTASQIRQDINYFGGFGQQGYGYSVPRLRQCIEQILGLDRTHRIAIVGVGNIGSAIARYPEFHRDGFEMVALFDASEARIGNKIEGLEILPADQLKQWLLQNPVQILVLATPSEYAQEIAAEAVSAGVRAIWNFTPVDLSLPDTVEVSNVHLSDSLMALTFRLHEREIHSRSEKWIRE